MCVKQLTFQSLLFLSHWSSVELKVPQGKNSNLHWIYIHQFIQYTFMKCHLNNTNMINVYKYNSLSLMEENTFLSHDKSKSIIQKKP